MTLTQAGLFEGYGGLSSAVTEVTGAELAWYSEFEPPSKANLKPSQAAVRLLAHHHPGVENYGDVTGINWAAVPTVDILTGGFPCTDVSSAGLRAGIRPDTRSGLWSHMARAIDGLRPRLVVIENVRGLLSAHADSAMEPCPWCVGNGPGSGLRALGAVLGDLVDLGYDARWCGLRAADVGAPHGRFRIFITAWPATGHAHGGDLDRWPAAGLEGEAGPPARPAPDAAGSGRRLDEQVSVSLNSRAEVCTGQAEPRRRGCTAVADSSHGADDGQRSHPELGLRGEAATDAGRDGREGGAECDLWPEGGEQAPLGGDLAGRILDPFDWGIYEPAVRRWEAILGRVVPPPTQTSARGGQQLSPRFVEWMQGLPDGHVTAVPGISRSDQLKLLGNGVVVQQAAAALRYLLADLSADRGVAA